MVRVAAAGPAINITFAVISVLAFHVVGYHSIYFRVRPSTAGVGGILPKVLADPVRLPALQS